MYAFREYKNTKYGNAEKSARPGSSSSTRVVSGSRPDLGMAEDGLSKKIDLVLKGNDAGGRISVASKRMSQ